MNDYLGFLTARIGWAACLMGLSSLVSAPAAATQKCQEAPRFELRNLEGEMDSLEAHLKKPGKELILISFFQKLCAGCREETRDILAWQAKDGPGKTTDFIMVSVQESRQRASEFLEENNFKAYVLADPYGRLTKPYSLTLLPKLVAVDSKGTLIRSFEPTELRKIRETKRFEETLNELHLKAKTGCR
jgi:peroxiredoxin